MKENGEFPPSRPDNNSYALIYKHLDIANEGNSIVIKYGNQEKKVPSEYYWSEEKLSKVAEELGVPKAILFLKLGDFFDKNPEKLPKTRWHEARLEDGEGEKPTLELVFLIAKNGRFAKLGALDFYDPVRVFRLCTRMRIKPKDLFEGILGEIGNIASKLGTVSVDGGFTEIYRQTLEKLGEAVKNVWRSVENG